MTRISWARAVLGGALCAVVFSGAGCAGQQKPVSWDDVPADAEVKTAKKAVPKT